MNLVIKLVVASCLIIFALGLTNSVSYRGGYFNRKLATAINATNNTRLVSITASTSTVAVAATGLKDQLTYFQAMFAGAISRSISQTMIHPINTYKTLLQLKKDPTRKVTLTVDRLLRGADAQFLLSLPHGALYFSVIELVKGNFQKFFPRVKPFIADFLSSSISTVMCSIVSTPQMVLTDRLMAGVYTSFPEALGAIHKAHGLLGFYAGWWPALAQKLPSYALTWMFFQQFKRLHEQYLNCAPNSQENFLLGALAAAGSVCVMNPMDTVKTRLVTQLCDKSPAAYKGVVNCFVRVLREEGVGAFYRSLPPRLLSVVPMIAIQFGIYEAIKKRIVSDRATALPALSKAYSIPSGLVNPSPKSVKIDVSELSSLKKRRPTTVLRSLMQMKQLNSNSKL